jgi:hypothetical protein
VLHVSLNLLKKLLLLLLLQLLLLLLLLLLLIQLLLLHLLLHLQRSNFCTSKKTKVRYCNGLFFLSLPLDLFILNPHYHAKNQYFSLFFYLDSWTDGMYQ